MWNCYVAIWTRLLNHSELVSERSSYRPLTGSNELDWEHSKWKTAGSLAWVRNLTLILELAGPRCLSFTFTEHPPRARYRGPNSGRGSYYHGAYSFSFQTLKLKQSWALFCPIGMCDYDLIINPVSMQESDTLYNNHYTVCLKSSLSKNRDFIKHTDLLESIARLNILTMQTAPLTYALDSTCLKLSRWTSLDQRHVTPVFTNIF